MAADRLAAIEDRLRACQERVQESPYSHPVASGWYAEDVLALVEVAKAARSRSSSHSHDCAFIQTWDGPMSLQCDCGADELASALARLDSGKKEK